MTDKEIVIKLIQEKIETNICDFKKLYYHESKKHDMIKDIIAFSNCTTLGDKYIIFNIDNETHEIGEMDINTLPDVSEINNLLREYCEPHIDIEINRFVYNNADIAYIKISGNNLDRPYIIKKDFSRAGKALLQQGQIFIRRNADNFKANRRDLDDIYQSREKREIALYSCDICQDDIIIDKCKTKLFHVRFWIKNVSKENFLINQIKVTFTSLKHSFVVNGQYISDESNKYLNPNDEIEKVPFSVLANTSIQKTLYFKISDSCINKLNSSLQNNEKYLMSIAATDIYGHTIITDSSLCNIKY